MRIRWIALLALLGGPAFAAPQDVPPAAKAPTPVPAVLDVRWPEIPTKPAPKPTPTPVVPPASTVPLLSVGVIDVIDSDVPLFILSVPAGAVKVTLDTNAAGESIKVTGKFLDTQGKAVTRKFKGKFVYTLEANVSLTRVTIIVVPSGVTVAKKILQRVYDVDDGTKPIPPPVDPIKPPVDPVLTPFQVKLKAAFIADGATKPQLAKYGALFKAAASSTVNDLGIATGDAMLKEMQSAVKNLGIPAGALNKTARTVADEINPTLAQIGTLDPAKRQSIAALFLIVAAATEVLSSGN